MEGGMEGWRDEGMEGGRDEGRDGGCREMERGGGKNYLTNQKTVGDMNMSPDQNGKAPRVASTCRNTNLEGGSSSLRALPGS
jgi:hypothetical protein